jgi:type VI protein secretion system component VasF
LVLEFNLFQVAAPKKKPKEKAEKVEATSAKGEAVQRMETLLKDSAAARTSSITLQSVEYAAELSRQLLQHAEALEGFYQRVKLAVEKDEDESFFKSLMVKIKEKEAFGVKAQASWVANESPISNRYLEVSATYHQSCFPL